MSKLFAVFESDLIINILLAETKEIAEIVSGMQAIEVTDLPIGVGWVHTGSRWVPPQPFNSWNFNENSYNWESPIPYPQDGKIYRWNEETLTWIEEIE